MEPQRILPNTPPSGDKPPEPSTPQPSDPSPQAGSDHPGFAGSSLAGAVPSSHPAATTAFDPANFSSDPLQPKPVPPAPPTDESPAPLPPPPASGPQEPLQQPAAMPAEPLLPLQHKPRRKGLLIGLIVGIVVLVLGASAAASYFYLANKPENVLKLALANSFDQTKTKTMQISGSVSSEEKSTNIKVEGTFTGNVDNTNGAFDMGMEIDALVTKLSMDARSTDGKTLYFKVGGLDGLSELLTGLGASFGAAEADLYSQLIESLNNQWIEINESLIKQYSGGAFDMNVISEADGRKIAEAYNQHSFMVIKETLPDEVIKGTNSYHYKLDLDKVKLKAFAAALKEAKLESLKISQDMLKMFNESVDEIQNGTFAVEAWVSKQDKLFTQFLLTAQEEDAVTKVRFTIDSYNKPFSVEKPTDAKSILELVGEYFGSDDFTKQFEDQLNQFNLESGQENGAITL